MDNQEIKSLDERIKALKEPKRKKKDNSATHGERVVAELFSGIIVGTFVGLGLDKYFETTPILTLIFIMLGLAGSLYNLYKATVQVSSEEEKLSSDAVETDKKQ